MPVSFSINIGAGSRLGQRLVGMVPVVGIPEPICTLVEAFLVQGLYPPRSLQAPSGGGSMQGLCWGPIGLHSPLHKSMIANMTKKLPISLEREPLLDAVFEVRLKGDHSLGDILPGILFHGLDPKPDIIRLPAAELPQPVRRHDPNLQYAPLQRLDWSNFVIVVGDSNLALACKLPYPGWLTFKSEGILKVMKLVAEAGIKGEVERFSVRYQGLIEAENLADQIGKVDLAIQLGTLDVKSSQIHLRVEFAEDGITHVLTMKTGTTAERAYDKREMSGLLVDIDSIQDIESMHFSDFALALESKLDKVRQANKALFFNHLKQEAIDELGPIYE